MRQLYTVPTATLAANRPAAKFYSEPSPGRPALSLVCVEEWRSDADEQAWEALPGVREWYPDELAGPAPAAAIDALAPWGATAGMTLRQVFRLARERFPCWQHR